MASKMVRLSTWDTSSNALVGSNLNGVIVIRAVEHTVLLVEGEKTCFVSADLKDRRESFSTKWTVPLLKRMKNQMSAV